VKSKQAQKALSTLGRRRAFELLESIRNEPKRFKELENLIPNKRTLSVRLQEMAAAGLIEKTHVKKGREYLAYKPTQTGEKLLLFLEFI